MKDNISRIKRVDGVKDSYSGERHLKQEYTSTSTESEEHLKDQGVILISGSYTSEEKERTILILQIASIAFIIISIFYVFNFLSTLIHNTGGAHWCLRDLYAV